MRDELSRDLLEWYDHNARTLPWRVGPAERQAGEQPDPYRVWLSEIMLQQTTVAVVKDYFMKFTARWPDVRALASSPDEDVMAAWAGLGYYARARNLLKCARVVLEDHGGVFPGDHQTLLGLPGIGPYTAAAIAAIAFDDPQVVVDGNVERVMARLHDDHRPLPEVKPYLTDYAAALTPPERAGDYAQGVMDLGSMICTPRRPACGLCPWRPSCAAWANGTAAELPKKTPKKRKPTRQGIAYLTRRIDGAWLLERRPDGGLLGGMLGWPTSAWGEDAPVPDPPIRAEWKALPGEVRHTFTHFHLRLRVMTALVPLGRVPERGEFVAAEDFLETDLPTVMRKAFELFSNENQR